MTNTSIEYGYISKHDVKFIRYTCPNHTFMFFNKASTNFAFARFQEYGITIYNQTDDCYRPPTRAWEFVSHRGTHHSSAYFQHEFDKWLPKWLRPNNVIKNPQAIFEVDDGIYK